MIAFGLTGSQGLQSSGQFLGLFIERLGPLHEHVDLPRLITFPFRLQNLIDLATFVFGVELRPERAAGNVDHAEDEIKHDQRPQRLASGQGFQRRSIEEDEDDGAHAGIGEEHDLEDERKAQHVRHAEKNGPDDDSDDSFLNDVSHETPRSPHT